MNTATVSAAVTASAAIGEAIRSLKTVPEGHLYARLMGSVTLTQFQSLLAPLVSTGLVKRHGNHLLEWVGDVAPVAQPPRARWTRRSYTVPAAALRTGVAEAVPAWVSGHFAVHTLPYGLQYALPALIIRRDERKGGAVRLTHIPTGLLAAQAKNITNAKRVADIFFAADVDWSTTDARALGRSAAAHAAYRTGRERKLII